MRGEVGVLESGKGESVATLPAVQHSGVNVWPRCQSTVTGRYTTFDPQWPFQSSSISIVKGDLSWDTVCLLQRHRNWERDNTLANCQGLLSWPAELILQFASVVAAVAAVETVLVALLAVVAVQSFGTWHMPTLTCLNLVEVYSFVRLVGWLFQILVAKQPFDHHKAKHKISKVLPMVQRSLKCHH